jgi:membrane protein YdbS with pleckstrin-like domain
VRRVVTGQSQPSDQPLPDDLLDRARRRRITLEEEPSWGVARYLFPTEKFRGEWRRHWIHPTKSILTTVLIAALAVWATVLRIKPRHVGWMVTAIVAGAVLLIAWRVAHWWLTKFVITNKRLMSTEGVVARRVAMMPLLRVTDMRYVQSVLGRALNYGTFTLESASRRNAMRRIVDLPNPNELYLRLVEEMYEPEAVEMRLARVAEDDGYDGDWAFDLAEDQAELAPLDVPAAVPRRRPTPRPRIAPLPDFAAPDFAAPDFAAPDFAPWPPDPATVHRELLDRIGTLASHLTALTAAIASLSPSPEPPRDVVEPPEPGGEPARAG